MSTTERPRTGLPTPIRVESTDSHQAWVWSNRDLPRDPIAFAVQAMCALVLGGGSLLGFVVWEGGTFAATIGFLLLIVMSGLAGFCVLALVRSLADEFLYIDATQFSRGVAIGSWFQWRKSVPLSQVKRFEDGIAKHKVNGQTRDWPALRCWWQAENRAIERSITLMPTVHPKIRAAMAPELRRALARFRRG